MKNPVARLRFGVLLTVAIFAAVQLADVVGASLPGGGPGVPPRPNVLMTGSASVTSYQVIGAGGSTGSIALGRTLVCAPCSVTVAVLDSSLAIVGGGAAGVLPPGKVYTFAGFVGEVSIGSVSNGMHVLTFAGGAEAIREVPPDWE